ncbi:MAG: hypothetical protein ACC653_05340 [Gammaproteobacteria bacterium]
MELIEGEDYEMVNYELGLAIDQCGICLHAVMADGSEKCSNHQY